MAQKADKKGGLKVLNHQINLRFSKDKHLSVKVSDESLLENAIQKEVEARKNDTRHLVTSECTTSNYTHQIRITETTGEKSLHLRVSPKANPQLRPKRNYRFLRYQQSLSIDIAHT